MYINPKHLIKLLWVTNIIIKIVRNLKLNINILFQTEI